MTSTHLWDKVSYDKFSFTTEQNSYLNSAFADQIKWENMLRYEFPPSFLEPCEANQQFTLSQTKHTNLFFVLFFNFNGKRKGILKILNTLKYKTFVDRNVKLAICFSLQNLGYNLLMESTIKQV